MLVVKPSRFLQVLGGIGFIGFGISVLYVTGGMRAPSVYIGLGMGLFGLIGGLYFLYCAVTGEGVETISGSIDPPSRSATDRMLELDDLRRRGLISDNEYRAKRADILSRL